MRRTTSLLAALALLAATNAAAATRVRTAYYLEPGLCEQRADGSWSGTGNNGSDAYATAMTVLSFAVPYRMLPIYQRDETVDPDSEKEIR